MSATVGIMLRSLAIGVAVAAPVGAMGVLCIQRTLARGWRAGLATGLGIATADAIYAALAAFGVSAISRLLVQAQSPLRVVGGIALVYLGVRTFLAPTARVEPGSVSQTSSLSLYTSAVGLTLTNPMTIMAFAAILASAGLTTQATASGATAATLGVALGSLGWWLTLVSATWLVRHAVSEGLLRWVNRLSGALVAAFGMAAIVAGIWP